jgi:rubrerythrin
MASIDPIGTTAECYAHAMAIEREGAARYAEFAELMAERGEEATAALFERLARFDAQHAEALAARASGFALPRVSPVEHSWVDDGPPESVSHELFQLLTPHHAIRIALSNAERAQALFEGVMATATDPEAQRLAAEISAEGGEQIRSLREALDRTPAPVLWNEDTLDLLPRLFGTGA